MCGFSAYYVNLTWRLFQLYPNRLVVNFGALRSVASILVISYLTHRRFQSLLSEGSVSLPGSASAKWSVPGMTRRSGRSSRGSAETAPAALSDSSSPLSEESSVQTHTGS